MTETEAAKTPDSPETRVGPSTDPKPPGARQPLLGGMDVDDKIFAGERRKALVTGAPEAPRPRSTNIRRSTHTWKLFGAMVITMLLMCGGLVAGLWHFYKTRVMPQIQAAPAPPATANVPAALPVKLELPPETVATLQDIGTKIGELQSQIDSLRQQQADAGKQMEGITERLASQAAAAATPAPAAITAPAIPAIIANSESAEALAAANTPAVHELRLMKERNRLSSWADEAIATGAREALQHIVDAMSDPDVADLKHAAQAEYFRVLAHFQAVSRIEPEYKLPLGELFPNDAGVRDESDLSTQQVLQLLADNAKDWRVRLRSAWLLGGRRSLEVGEALLKALHEDPSLDVAKEAQLSFEQNTEHSFRLFDIPAIDAWWKSQTGLRTEPVPRAELRAQKARQEGKGK